MMEEAYNLGIKYKGKLTPSGVPYLKVKIKGFENNELYYYSNGFDAILDTGAVKTHITPQLAIDLKLMNDGEDIGLYPLKDSISITKVYNLDFYINGIENIFTYEFKEMPYGFQFPIIFGTEFLKKCKSLNIDFINNEYALEL